VDFDGPANNLTVTQIFSTGYAFAALRSDGSVVSWGDSSLGGDSSGVDFDGPANNLRVVGFANPFTDDRLVFTEPLPAITLAVSPAAVAEDGTSNLVYTFSRTGPTSSGLSVNYTVGGTATLGTDYTGIAATPATKTVSFAAGSATATLTIDPTVDTTIEPDETVALTLAASSGYIIGTTVAVVGTILNDDTAIEIQGNTKLLRRGDGKAFVEVGAGGTRREINSPSGVTAGSDSSEWQMVAAETIAGTNQILWRNNTANFLHLWTLDANWTWQSASGADAFNTPRAWELETIFQVDATRDGITGAPPTTLESQGNTKLLKRGDGKAFVEVGAGGTRREINSPSGVMVGSDSSEWQMVAAETIAGSNQILWRNNTANFLHLWSLDANWTWQSASGADGFNTPRAWELETTFQVDATRDGITGAPPTPLESQGNTKLLRRGDGKAFVEYGAGTRQEINSPSGVTVGSDSSEWQMVAAEMIAGVNQILWRNNTANYLHLWSLDANWTWQSSSGADAFNTPRAWELETIFQVDATRDGITGAPTTTLEAQGNTKLLKRSDGRAFVEVGTARQEITSPWGSQAGDDSSEWQMIAADTIGAVNQILWRNNTSSFLHIWSLDANWSLQSTNGSDAFDSPRAWELETSFQMDATRDGIIGSPFTTIESQGNTKLLKGSDGRAFVEVGTARQEITSPWGSQAGDDSSEWQMIAADTISGVNQILWRNNTSSFLHIWSLDPNWSLQSTNGSDAFNSPRAWELETSFQMDANRDGIIGSPFTTIESQGNTKLLKGSDGRAFVEVGTARQEITSPWGSQTGDDSSEWQMLAADTISGVNQILWRNNTSSFLHIWSLDANWSLQSANGSDAFNSPRAWELETSFQIDATKDGLIGAPFTSSSL
jgi:hypothetical protein